NAGDQPVVKLEIIVQSGISKETQSGLSWITGKTLSEGSSKKNANEIAGLFEFYGSFIEISPGFDNTSIVLHTPKKYFIDSVKLLAEILFSPSFPEKEIDILKMNKIEQLKINNEKSNFIASRKTREALFGLNHPYGKSLSEGEVELLSRGDIQKYFDSNFYKNPEFFLSGLVDNTEIEVLSNHFDLPLNQNESNSKTDKKSVGTNNIFIEKSESVQSSIRLAWKIPHKGHPDHYKIMMLNEILGGYFSSRLMKNLREDKGYTYGVHSYPIFLKEDSFFLISADVIAESTTDAIDEIHKEINILKNNLVSSDELETVRNYMAGTFLSSVSTPFQLMEKFKTVHSHRLDYRYFDSFFKSLKNITAEEILQTANSYLKADDLHTIVVGKK
ncbi:MAG: zinc protease, partial [Vicingaceae bacterium]